MTSLGELDVVVVSYRSRDVLRDCLRSLRAFGPSVTVRTCVVDNGSDDGTMAMIARQFPEVDLVAAGENLGFARATNVGILRGSAPYVLALNPDTRVTEGVLDGLLDLMEARREVGICGCRLELEDGTFDHASKRSFPTVLGALGHFSGVGRRPDAHEVLSQYRAPGVDEGPVDAINGAFMLMRRAALEEVGLFDERYWMYMEDLELCYRFAQAGWTTWYEPAFTVFHKKGGTVGRHRDLRLNYAFHFGMYRFYRSHYAPRRNVLVNGAVYVGIAVKFLLCASRTAIRRRLERRAPTLAPASTPAPRSARQRQSESSPVA